MTDHAEEGIDVVVRFHDMRRLEELGRAVFSLVGQSYRPLRILLALQRFTPAEQAVLRDALAPLLALGEVEAVLLDYDRPRPEDARSELVNLGFAAATGRFLALLDHDDALHPDAYHALIGRLRQSGAAIAFARTPLLKVDMSGAFPHALSRAQPFTGTGLHDLFTANFCPIHSFVLDRRRVPPGLLRFEPSLTIEEDYDFLLRVCAEVPADFARLDSEIGLYVQKTDGSNTLPIGVALGEAAAARAELARQFIELRRRMVALSPEVQANLGIAEPRRGLTIRAWLDEQAARAAEPGAP